MSKIVPTRINKKTHKLTEYQKTQIITRLVNGEGTNDLAREYGVTKSSISHLSTSRNKTAQIIKQDMQEHEISIQKRLLDKTYKALERKIDTLSETAELKKARIDHISGVAQDLWKQSQVEAGKPTDITTSKNTDELKIFIRTNIEQLKTVEPTNLLNEFYD